MEHVDDHQEHVDGRCEQMVGWIWNPESGFGIPIRVPKPPIRGWGWDHPDQVLDVVRCRGVARRITWITMRPRVVPTTPYPLYRGIMGVLGDRGVHLWPHGIQRATSQSCSPTP